MQMGNMMRKLMIGVVVLAMSHGVALAQADDAPLTEGNLWNESSHVEKIAYLAGASDFLEVEYVVQQQSGSPPTDEQSAVREWWDSLEDETLNNLIAAIDAYYADNPDQLSVPVMVVIWNSFVETD
jgi:hypothetical protein